MNLKTILIIVAFCTASLLSAQSLSFSQDTVHDEMTDPFGGYHMFPMPMLHCSFFVETMIEEAPGSMTMEVPLSYEVLDVQLPDEWSFEYFEIMLGQGIFYPPATGQTNAFVWTEPELVMNYGEFDVGNNLLGGQLITTIWVYPTNASTAGDTLTLIKWFCPGDENIDLINFDTSNPICANTTLDLMGADGFENYLWSNASQEQSITWEVDEMMPFVALEVEDQFGCMYIQHLDLEIQESIEEDLIFHDSNAVYCPGQLIELAAVAGYDSYDWSTGDEGQIITTNAGSASIGIVALDEFGCEYTDEVALNIQEPTDINLCMVTVNSDNKNRLIWEKDDTSGVQQYNIYKQTSQANQYELIAEQDYDVLSEYVDKTSMVDVQSERYRITNTDICGTESLTTESHKTMHLTVSSGLNGSFNLIWEKYEGLNYSTFNIYRGTTPTDISLIAERPSNTFTFTDLDPPLSATLYYQIEVVAPAPCDPTKIENSIRSNLSQVITSAVENESEFSFEIFPNPATDYLQFSKLSKAEQVQLLIVDVMGKVVWKKEMFLTAGAYIDIQDLPKGYYVLKFENSKFHKSFIKH